MLYLARTLKEHTLLQAIARVNRVAEGKEFGYIVDYCSVLGELSQALSSYSALEGFDEADLAGTVTSIRLRSQSSANDIPSCGTSSVVSPTRRRRGAGTTLADEAERDEFYDR